MCRLRGAKPADYPDAYQAASRPVLDLIASLLGAVLGGVRAARIEPSDGLREN